MVGNVNLDVGRYLKALSLLANMMIFTKLLKKANIQWLYTLKRKLIELKLWPHCSEFELGVHTFCCVVSRYVWLKYNSYLINRDVCMNYHITSLISRNTSCNFLCALLFLGYLFFYLIVKCTNHLKTNDIRLQPVSLIVVQYR